MDHEILKKEGNELEVKIMMPELGFGERDLTLSFWLKDETDLDCE